MDDSPQQLHERTNGTAKADKAFLLPPRVPQQVARDVQSNVPAERTVRDRLREAMQRLEQALAGRDRDESRRLAESIGDASRGMAGAVSSLADAGAMGDPELAREVAEIREALQQLLGRRATEEDERLARGDGVGRLQPGGLLPVDFKVGLAGSIQVGHDAQPAVVASVDEPGPHHDAVLQVPPGGRPSDAP